MHGRQAGLKSRSTNGEEAWKSHAICPTVCAEPSLRMLPAHYRHYHPRRLRLHQSIQPWGLVIKGMHCALHKWLSSHSHWTIYNNTQLHAKGPSSSAELIMCPSELLPVGIFWEATRSVSVVMLFYLWASKKFTVFWRIDIIITKTMKCLQWNSVITICGGDNTSDGRFH